MGYRVFDDNGDPNEWVWRAIRLSRSYCPATDREVSWRYARGEFQQPNFRHSEEGQEKRNNNWDKEAQKYSHQLREQAKLKHDYESMPTGYCAVCGEREWARISHTSHGVTVWRRVHTNPKVVHIKFFDELGADDSGDPIPEPDGKLRCPGSGSESSSLGRNAICPTCQRAVVINLDGRFRRHKMW
jgi:hypothetical protein